MTTVAMASSTLTTPTAMAASPATSRTPKRVGLHVDYGIYLGGENWMITGILSRKSSKYATKC